MKLSKAQQRIVDLMNDGWELGYYDGLGGGYRIQKGGLGSGGDSERVRCDTAYSLIKKAVIVPNGERSFPITRRYVLAEEYRGVV